MSRSSCDLNALRPVDEAIAELLALAPSPPPAEPVPLDQALGMTLAEPVLAPWPMPRWDNSALDGYALRAADLPAEGGYLPLAGRVAAGDGLSALAAGHAVRIFTGAPWRSAYRAVQTDCDPPRRPLLPSEVPRGLHR